MQLFARSVAWLCGACEALLLARLMCHLLAARPDNPSVALLNALTAPLITPFALVDAGQPLFGARLELATLLLAIVVPLMGYVVWVILSRSATTSDPAAS